MKEGEFAFGVTFWMPFSGRARHGRTRHDCSQETTGSGVVWRFDVGATWTRILNGKAYGRSQWFLSLHCAASGLEKPLLAGYVFGRLNVSIARYRNFFLSWTELSQGSTIVIISGSFP